MKQILILILALCCTAPVLAQQPDPVNGLVKWISLEEAMTRQSKVPKPILIDFYTNWCGWCKHMMKTTYSQPNLADYINNYFYPVKFNAEGKDTITYLGKVYKPTDTIPRSPHEFTILMLGSSLSYPTTVFLNGFDPSKQEFALNMRAPGFLEQKKFEPILIYVVENVYRNSSYEDFSAQFERAFRDSTLENVLKTITWKKPVEFFNNPVSGNKKSIVYLNTNWCNSCKVMQRASFSDPLVLPYIDSTFTLIDFNPEIKDSLQYQGKTYYNPGQQQNPFHDLSRLLCKNNLTIPAMAILDEKNNLLDAIPFYLPPTILKKVLFYYGEDVYKNKSWAEYMQTMK